MTFIVHPLKWIDRFKSYVGRKDWARTTIGGRNALLDEAQPSATSFVEVQAKPFGDDLPTTVSGFPAGTCGNATRHNQRRCLTQPGAGTSEASRMAACRDLNSLEVTIPKAMASRVIDPFRNWWA